MGSTWNIANNAPKYVADVKKSVERSLHKWQRRQNFQDGGRSFLNRAQILVMSVANIGKGAGPIKKILVPVDGSETSFKAANYALHLAKAVKAELVPINIIEDVKQGGAIGLQARYGNVSIVEAFKKAKKRSAEDWLEKIEKSAEKSGVKTRSVILDSKGRNEKKILVDYAKKNRFDLIVIGSKGGSRFKGLWIGGFTNFVVHHSKVPVVIVP